MSLKKLLIASFLLISILGLVGWVMTKNDKVVNEEVTTESSEEVNVEAKKPAMITPESWLEYRGKMGDYSIRYPAELKLTEDGEQAVRLIFPEYKPRMGDTNFAYVSVVPKEKSESIGEYYNYNNTQIAKLMRVAVGEIVNISELDGQKEWFSYKRLPDISLGENVARGFENKRPWEFPAGTTELYYIVETDNFTYVIGGYSQDVAGLQLSELEMIIASFRIIGT